MFSLTSLKGIRVKIKTLGCRTNIYEAEAIADSFRREGAVISEDLFDVGILVSCAVTKTAEKKCRQFLRQLKRESPDALIVLCGCYVQALTEEELSSLGADLYVGNRLKSDLPGIVAKMLNDPIERPLFLKKDVLSNDKWDALELSRVTFHTRSFVKVQDGCNRFCSYCIVPFLRGHPTSRSVEEVAEEVKRLVDQGCKEVVLTGIHLGLYGYGCDFDLGDLINALSRIEGLRRLRFGSIEPHALSDRLIDVLAESDIFCRHLHVPLQSGDDRILSLMQRGYRIEDFINIIRKIRRKLGDDVHISTDVIVGFPGEDEDAFQNTLNLVDALGMGRVHVFPFSPRPGTKAYDMPGRLEGRTIKSRVVRATKMGRLSLQRYAQRWLNRKVDILVEHNDGEKVKGLSRHFLEVETSLDQTPSPSVKAFQNGEVGFECEVCVLEAKHGILYGVSSVERDLSSERGVYRE